MNLSRPYQEQNFSEWMDQFRWIAAFIVVISHVGGPLLVSLSAMQADQRPAPQYLYSFIAGFSHQAVIIFFVLSGYFVGGALCFEAKRKEPDASSYFSKRLSRLWVVLIPTLIISYILYKIGYSLAPIVYDSRKNNFIDINTLMCNIFFLQNVFCGIYASNDSLWSLYNEFWYYLIFFLIVKIVTVKNIKNKIFIALVLTFIISTLSFYQRSNAPLAPYFLIWLFGVYVAWANKPQFLPSVSASSTLVIIYLISSRVFLGTENMNGVSFISFVSDLILSALFVKLLINMKYANNLGKPFLKEKNVFIASFSYSLYCIHLPLALFYSSITYYLWGLGHEMIADTAIEWLIVVGCIIFIVCTSYIFSLFTERHTNFIRNYALYNLKKIFNKN